MLIAALPFPDISPEIFSITVFGRDFALRWYAMAYIMGILLGWWIIKRCLARATLWPNNTAPMKPADLEDLVTWIIIGVILGGRLGYVLFYRFSYYLAHPLEILQLWEGGMAFHGGFLGVIVAVALFCRTRKLPLAQISDSLAIVAPIGLFFGRIANFINGELWGRVSDVPWAVEFPGAAAQSCLTLDLVCARHPSQLYEAGLEGLLLGLLIAYLVLRKSMLKRPWTITGVFFAGYGVSRFIVEFFRQPDAQFVTLDNPLGLALHVGGYGLTMGQILSLPMIAIGVTLILRAKRV